MTCSAGVATSVSTSFADAPGNGINTLAMVTLICGSSSRGVTRTANRPSSSATSAMSGVNCECRKNFERRPAIPMVLFTFDLQDTKRLKDVFFINRFGRAFFHLSDEIFFKRYLRQMHPFSLREPVDIARRNLWHCDERNAVIAKVGQADRVPGCLGAWLASFQLLLNIVSGGGHHRLDHVARFWRADRYRRHFDWRYCHANADGIDIFKSGIALMLIDQNETARIGQAFNAEYGIDTLE